MAAAWVLTLLLACGTTDSHCAVASAASVVVDSQACKAWACPSQREHLLIQSQARVPISPVQDVAAGRIEAPTPAPVPTAGELVASSGIAAAHAPANASVNLTGEASSGSVPGIAAAHEPVNASVNRTEEPSNGSVSGIAAAHAPANASANQTGEASNGSVCTPDDGDDDFFTNEEESIDDDEEAEQSLATAFDVYDLDASGSLNAEEIHHGVFDGEKLQELKVAVNASHGHAPKMNVSRSVAALDLGTAHHFISLHDADHSGTLSKAEFLAALVNKHTMWTHEMGLIQTGNIAECVVDVIRKVWDAAGCLRELWQKSCQWWNLQCWWRKVTQVVGCWLDEASKVAASFDQCRDMVVEAVKDAAGGVAKGFMDLLPRGCTSPDSCKDALVKGTATLLGQLGREIAKAAGSVLGEDLQPGLTFVAESLSKVPALAAEVSGVASQSATAIADLAKSSVQTIGKYAKVMDDLCCRAGKGFWYVAPTDCGAFEQLKKTINNVWRVDKISENFAKTVGKFSQCIAKTGLLSLPSPFMDIKVESYCLPQFLQTPIKGVVGAFQYFIGQLRAGENGCQSVGSGDQPICKLMVDIQDIGLKLKQMLDKKTALLQAAAGAGVQLGAASSLAADTYRADCAGKDFKVFLEFGIGISFPQPSGEALGVTMAFEGGGGCKNQKPFFDLSLGFGVDRTILGADLPTAGIGPSVAIGFEAGTSQDEVFDTSTTLKFAGGVSLKMFGISVEGTSEMGLNILPQFDHPKGFKIGPPISAAVLLQTQDATQRAVQSAEGYDFKVLAAIAGFSQSLARADLASQFEQIPRPHALLQQGAAAGNNLTAALRSSVLNLSLIAGVEFKFCLTCLSGTKDAEPAFKNTSSLPTERVCLNYISYETSRLAWSGSEYEKKDDVEKRCVRWSVGQAVLTQTDSSFAAEQGAGADASRIVAAPVTIGEVRKDENALLVEVTFRSRAALADGGAATIRAACESQRVPVEALRDAAMEVTDAQGRRYSGGDVQEFAGEGTEAKDGGSFRTEAKDGGSFPDHILPLTVAFFARA